MLLGLDLVSDKTAREKVKVRLAQRADLPKLESLRRAMSDRDSLLHDRESSRQIAIDRLRGYFSQKEELADWQLLVLTTEDEPRAYLLFVVDHEHGVTHQLQAVTLDYAVSTFDHLEALVRRARAVVAAFENEYLVIDLPAADKRHQLWFYRCGFRAEQQRVVKRLPHGHRGASSPSFQVRPARQEDLPFILEVHARNTPAYLPAGREVDSESVEARYQLTYLALDLEGEEGAHYLLMEEKSSGIPAGYIFLRPGLVSATRSSLYIYDVAVAPQFASRGLSRYLIGAAETLASELDMTLYGDGSTAVASLVSWHTQIGFTVDSYLYALDCRGSRKALDVKGM